MTASHTLWVAGTSPTVAGVEGRLPFECRLQVITRGGKLVARDGGLQVQGADEVFILIAGATGYKRFDDISADPAQPSTRQTLAAAATRGPEALRASAPRRPSARCSTASPSTSAPAPTVPCPPTSASPASPKARTPASRALPSVRPLPAAGQLAARLALQPANLQGLWNEKTNPSWGSKWTININTEMNYWPAELCNIGETVEPLFAMVEDLAITGAKVRREEDVRCAWLGGLSQHRRLARGRAHRRRQMGPVAHGRACGW